MRIARMGLVVVLTLAGSAGAARAGEDFSGQNLSGRDFSRQDLKDANFEDCNLSKCIFHGAILRGANLQGADLAQSTFNDADMTGADLRDARIDVTQFFGTNLSKANLEGQDLKRANLRGTKFRGANLRNTKAWQDLTECDLSGADLSGAFLLDAQDFRKPSIQAAGAKYDKKTRWPSFLDPKALGAVLVEARDPAAPAKPEAGMSGGEPATPGAKPSKPGTAEQPVGQGPDRHGQDLRGRDLRGEDLEGANLSKCILMSVNLQGAVLKHADLRGADLTSARLDGADLTGADLRGANLNDAHLDGANFAKANLEGIDLHVVWGMNRVNFKGANLRDLKGLGVVFSDVDFSKADLRGAHLAGPSFDVFRSCRWRGCLYDGRTRWPKGFDTEGVGAVRADEPAAAEEATDPDDPFPGDPPRLMAPDKDPEAPNEGTVKKEFESEFERIRALVIQDLSGGSDIKGKAVWLRVGGVRRSFAYEKIVYYQPSMEQVQWGRDAVMAYPVRVVCRMTSESADGSEEDVPVTWDLYYYKAAGGTWTCRRIHDVRSNVYSK